MSMRVLTCAAFAAALLIHPIDLSGQTAAPPSTAKPVQPPPGTAAPPVSPAAPAKTAPITKPAGNTAPVLPAQPPLPDDYVIGPDDILVIVFWREKDLSTEASVRPDGKISIPLLQDVDAAGLTPEQLRDSLNKQAQRFVEDPNATVIVKEINSRQVFITGQVSKPGPYRLGGPTTVVQLIAMAGGLLEYADQENVAIMRVENGTPVSHRFNYKDIAHRRNLKQNIMLKPGDTVVVP
jgi:polysaccharide export outer membrane protein